MSVWSLPGYTHLRDLVRDESGHVVLARHDASGETVAIRYLPADAEAGDRQATVAARLAGLADPRLAAPRECVESDSGFAIVRNLVDGVALRALLVEEGAIGPGAALVVLADVLRGLAAAHDRGVMHGDCRPGTVLVSRTGGAVLVDIGIASPNGRELMAAGTPFYLAPEQWGGAQPEQRADIYAATATFFECVVGAPPYFGMDPARLRDRHETAPLPVDALPGPLQELTGYGLAKRLQDRPATAREFLAEIEAAAAHGYGADWESQGRAELTRLAAGPQPTFPLDATTAQGVPRSRAPAAAPHRPGAGRLGQVVAVAAVVAACTIGLVNVLPSDTPADERGSTTGYVRAVPPAADPARPMPTSESLPAEPRSDAPAPQAAAAEPGSGDAASLPPDEHSGTAPTSRAVDTGAAAPAPRVAPPGTPPRITALSIDSFREQGNATRLVVHVDTSGSGPVELFIGYGSGRSGELGATTMRTMTRELSGHTSYAVIDERDLATECLDYWVVTVFTEAGETRDSATLSGAPCASGG